MVHKLCVRSLQCGLGSMDYIVCIHSLLIMEDDNDSDTEREHSNVYSETPLESESTDSQHASAVAGAAPNPSAASNSLPWCKCSVCIVVVREDVLQHLQGSASFVWTQMCCSFVLEIVHVRNDRDDNSTRAFRKAAYRQFILDRYGHLGKGNRKVCPSCLVKTVRGHYPSQTGAYMRYRPE